MAQSRFVRIGLIALSALVLASSQPRAQAQPRRADHVVILMLDGTRPDFLRDVSTPTIEGLMAAGTVYTQAETTYPSQTRVAFVTLPTGSYPGHHGIVGAGTIKGPSWESLAMGDEDHPEAMQALVARPTFFEEATAAGLTSLYAGMKGYELVGARGATWTINGHRTLDPTAYVSRYEPEVLGSRQLAHFYKQQLSRQLLDQSLAIFKEHKPNLSIINVGSADYSAHSFGPDTVEYRETLRYIDGLIATLLKELDDMKLRDRTTIIISADHGFSQVDGRNVVAPVGTQGPPQLDALSALNIEHLVSNTGGTSMGVYIRDKARVAEAATAIRKQPWFEAMYCEDPKVGCSRSLSELHTYFPGRSPDLMVDIDDDATLNYPRPGNHGSLRPSDMRIPLILSGAGIARGARFGKASLIDVAPTVVKLLGLPGRILKPDGRVLEEALLP